MKFLRFLSNSLLAVGFLASAFSQTAASASPATQVVPPGHPFGCDLCPPGPPQSSISSPVRPQGEWRRSQISMAHCSEPPKIDGKLDDACWLNATHMAGFYRLVTADPITEQTEVWICADDKRLYIAFHCLDSHPEQIRAQETQRDGNVDQDDYVLVLIDSQNSRRNGSQFIVNARGTQVTQVEGGTADNITWAGDWKGAAVRTADGWSAEMSIPFALMRYPRGTKSFPILFARKMARESYHQVWPFIPKGDDVTTYLHDFTGINPPFIAPRPIFLPYLLGSAGDQIYGRAGLDVKYPISTTLTGVATLFPDFATVEQAVQDISFSYTEKYVPDRRPFFAEGSDFLSDSYMFYSQRIPKVDQGFKVVGKQGPTTIGLIGTTAQGADDGQTALVANVQNDLGPYSSVGMMAVGNNQMGLPANRVGRIYGQLGWKEGVRQFRFNTNRTESWLAGGPRDHSDWLQFQTFAGNGKPYVMASYGYTGQNFDNQLGLIGDTNVKGWNFDVNQYNRFDHGHVEDYVLELYANTTDRATGGFFRDDISLFSFLGMRNGIRYQLSADFSKREDFHDQTTSAGLSWGRKSLFQRGGVNYTFGRQADQPYTFVSLGQGFLVTRPFSLNLSYNHYRLGSDNNDQLVLSGTYRLSGERTFGGRLVRQGGDTNAYLSFGQHVRAGYDAFVLIGDPNSARTKGILTFKVIHPF